MIKYAPYLLIAVIAGAFWFQNSRIETLSGDLSTANEQVKKLKERQNNIDSQLEQFNSDKQYYDQRFSELEKTGRVRKSELDKMKKANVTDPAQQKEVERIINDEFKRTADILSCSTGAMERCVKQ